MEWMELLIGDGLTFLSFGYLFFLLAAALVRYLCPRRERAAALLLLSWAFYCTWNPACLLFVLVSTVSTWLTGLYVGTAPVLPGGGLTVASREGSAQAGATASDDIPKGGGLTASSREGSAQAAGAAAEGGAGFRGAHRKLILILCLVLNLGLLFFCKYWSMFFPGFEDRLLPVGISFYTLQAVGYVIDCWRYGSRPAGTAKAPAGAAGESVGQTTASASGTAGQRGAGTPQKNRTAGGASHPYMEGTPPETRFINYALFVSFFPGILSGPIERGRNMLPQFDEPCDFRYDNLRDGLTIMLWGYFLKMVLADRIAIAVDAVYANPEGWGGAVVLLAVLLYSVQIYCDFAGYSAIAVGSARILGFQVMNNFEAPYLSGSVAEFWRRWHISLSGWLRDYLYIALGGSRRGTGRQYLNILIVFAVSGLWHGADITFVVWGLLHGLYQVIGYILRPVRDGVVRLLNIDRGAASHRFLKTAVTFLLVSLAWVFFRADSMEQALRVLNCLPGIRIGTAAAAAGGGAVFAVRTGHALQIWQLFDGTLLSLGLDTMNWVLLSAGIAFLFIRDLCVLRGISLRERIQAQGRWLRWTLYIAAVLLILVCGVWGPDYDAATFIYSQF